MKKVISLALALFMCISVCVFSTSALEADGFTYTESDGVAIITGYNGTDTDLTIPATLNSLPVAKIDDEAFYQNHNITSVTIEDGIESIGEKAFYNCTGLKSVVVPDSVTEMGNSAFSYCVHLEEVILGSGLKKISNNCFSHDTRLEAVSIPEGIEEFDDGAFEMCTHLKMVVLPSSLKRIGRYAFAYTNYLTDITLPTGLEVVDEGAFYFSAGLTSVNFPSTVTSLGNYAFFSCNALSKVDLNEGLITIGDMAFDGTAVKSLYIPSTVSVTGQYPFGYTYNEETFEYDHTPGFTALCVEGSYGAQYCESFGIPYSIVSEVTPYDPPAPTYTNPPQRTEPETKATTPATTAAKEQYKQGDVTQDGKVNTVDTTAISKHIAFLDKLKGEKLKLADFDSDNKVNIKDVTKVMMTFK